MALPQPINPFAEKPAGYFPQQAPADYNAFGVQPGPWASPTQPGLAANPISSPKAPQPASAAFQYLMPATAGAGTGSSVKPTTSAPSAVMQTVGAGVSGAASGAAMGTAIAPGPGTAIGAGVGGLVGLVSGGIQSYYGLRDARAQKREMNRRIKEIDEKEAERVEYQKQLNAQSRADNKEQQGYDRRRNALASQWSAFQSVMGILNKGMQDDEQIKSLFLERGR